MPPQGDNSVDVEPLPWTWLHWWEANRDQYLIPVGQEALDQDQQGVMREQVTQRVVEALTQSLEDPFPEPRRAAMEALAKIARAQDQPLFDTHFKDQADAFVKHRGLFGLSMLGDPDAQKSMLGYDYPTSFLHAAGLLGFASVDQWTPRVEPGLKKVMNQRQVDALRANAAAESLLLNTSPKIDRMAHAKRVIEKSPSPWIAARAIVTLGRDGDEKTDVLLSDIALNAEGFKRVAAWRFLNENRSDKAYYESIASEQRDGMSIPNAISKWWDAHEQLAAMAPEPEQRPDDMWGVDPGIKLTRGKRGESRANRIEDLYMMRMRIAAVIALAERKSEAATPTLLQLLEENSRPKWPVHRDFAAVGLGEIGDPEALPTLIRYTQGRPGKDQGGSNRVRDEDPTRGFAAIGLGLYARPYESEQGTQDRLGFEKAIDALFSRLLDDKETDEVRCASAIALGITRRTSILPHLAVAARTIQDKDNSPLRGYVMLARAMVGDGSHVADIESLLRSKQSLFETPNLLKRRAAVMALGMIGRREVLPVLIDAWEQPYHVNREVIKAIALTGAIGIGEELLEHMTDPENQYEHAYMAEALGELLAAQRPSKLSRFLIGRDFTMKDGLLEDHRQMINPFLYRYLIPEFDELWY